MCSFKHSVTEVEGKLKMKMPFLKREDISGARVTICSSLSLTSPECLKNSILLEKIVQGNLEII